MIRNTLLLALCLLMGNVTMAQDDENDTKDHADREYKANSIKTELRKDADAVVRSYDMDIEVVSETEINVTKWYAVTVLNEFGDRYAGLAESYNKLIKLESVHGWLYDENDKQIKKLKRMDLTDLGYATDAFFDEYRHVFYDFNYRKYPYTVVYKTVRKYKTGFVFPYWDPQPGANCSVEHASLKVSYPEGLKVNYKMLHTDKRPVVATDKGVTTLSLNIDDIMAFHRADKFSTPDYHITPSMQMSCDKVQLEDFTGSLATWKDFGAFVYSVNADRDDLPPATRKLVHELTDTCTSDFSKIDVLYRYMQRSTRYVNIVLGIGGWQTLEASKVAEKGYGDCKALSNYTRALLKEAGISANLVLVEGDATPDWFMDESFPAPVFNHMILCVPGAKDTVWLECTSKATNTGYLSTFTGNRKALMLTPAGGVVVRTPTYDQRNSKLSRIVKIHINDKDEWQGTVAATYTGFWWDKESHVLTDGQKDVKEHFNRQLLLPTYSVKDYKVDKTIDNRVPGITERISFDGTGNISKAGKRLFLSPRILDLKMSEPDKNETRVDSFVLYGDFEVMDTTVITFQNIYDAEKLATDINVDYPFASYHTHAVFTANNELQIVTRLVHKSGTYPPSMFADYVKVARMINKGLAYDKVVLNAKS